MKYTTHLAALACGATISSVACAAEDFQVRYNLAGSLAGEVFVPPDTSGPAFVYAFTYVDIKKVTGSDGKTLHAALPGGAVPLPAPTPSALYPTYPAQAADVFARGTLKLSTLAAGYITGEKYGGGRFAFGVSLPYGSKLQTISVDAATPVLSFNPAIPAAAQTAISRQFASGYQSTLQADGDASSGKTSGFGDLELQAGWFMVDQQFRLQGSLALVLPTGKYSPTAGPDIGFGNFYTLRPSVQLGYLFTPDLALVGKASIGFNSRNKDNDLRSGNWASVEGALGYKTRIGAIGVHSVYVQQYEDDSDNPFGTSRLKSLNVGAYFTTKILPIDTAVTLQYMATTSSRNAKSGGFSQVRLVKVW